MSHITDRWYRKALVSFEAGRNYQGVRELTSALVRGIEGNATADLQLIFVEVANIFDERQMWHEAGQVVSHYLKHLRKHKLVETGVVPLLGAVVDLVSVDGGPTSIALIFLQTLVADALSSQDKVVLGKVTALYNEVVDQVGDSDQFEDFTHVFFDASVGLGDYSRAKELSVPFFLDNVTSLDQLSSAVNALFVLGLVGETEVAFGYTQSLRKTLPPELQQEPLFECGADLLLAVRGHDLEWFNETRKHFSAVLGRPEQRQLRILVQELYQQEFPDAPKSSLFDLFL